MQECLLKTCIALHFTIHVLYVHQMNIRQITFASALDPPEHRLRKYGAFDPKISAAAIREESNRVQSNTVHQIIKVY